MQAVEHAFDAMREELVRAGIPDDDVIFWTFWRTVDVGTTDESLYDALYDAFTSWVHDLRRARRD